MHRAVLFRYVVSAVAAAAEGTVSRAAVARCVKDEKSDDYEPDYLVVKKIAKAVHVLVAPESGAVLSFDFRARLCALISFYATAFDTVNQESVISSVWRNAFAARVLPAGISTLRPHFLHLTVTLSAPTETSYSPRSSQPQCIFPSSARSPIT